VIEGNVTDQPGPYEVIVSMASPVWQPPLNITSVTGALVIIEDDHGNREELKEGSDGHYYTATLQGQVGYTYTLSVKIGDDYLFQSQPEKMTAVGDFSLKSEFKLDNPLAQEAMAKLNQSLVSKNGFAISLDSEILPEQNGKVWWRVHGIYHIFTFAYLRVKPAERGFGWVPDPPTCSGYKSVKNVLTFVKSPCACCDCWVDEYNRVPLLSDLRFTNGGAIADVPVFFVNVNRRTFFDKYYLEVEQLSLSDNVYNFWSMVKKQQSNSSNLFQTPPPVTRGNIFSVADNGPEVIGYFSASAVKKHAITFNRFDVPYPILPIDTIPQTCSDYWRYGSYMTPHISTVKPTFW
jgi:hypothetical protein